MSRAWKWLAVLGLFLAVAGQAKEMSVCTGDLSARKISVDLHETLLKGCVKDTDGKVEMSAVLTSGTLVFGGETSKKSVRGEVVYTNIHEVGGKPRRYTVKMRIKDKIRAEGAMADHYVGSLEVAEAVKGTTDYRVLHTLDGLHFYTESPDHEMHWGYDEKVGPAQWGKLKADWETCLEGEEQSPVNISIKHVAPMDADPIEFNYKEVSASLVNNGHALQANVGEGCSIRVAGKTYRLLQFHVHTPSEHFIDEKTSPMEVHFVHQADDKSLAVVGMMVEAPRDGKASGAVADLLKEFPNKVNQPREFSRKLNPERWLPARDKRAYYTYAGSLTTPPCSEKVRWHVRAEHAEVSPTQIKAIKAIVGGDNARHPALPLGRRNIRFSPR